MDAILADPTVRAVIIGVIMAFGAYLVALLRRLSAKMDEVETTTTATVALVDNQGQKLQEVAETTTATITLVDGQLSEVKGQLKEMMEKWEGSQHQLAAEKEKAADVAVQTIKDTAAQIALQAVKDVAAQEVQAALKASTPPLAVVNGGGTQSVTVPSVTVPVHETPPPEQPSRIVKP